MIEELETHRDQNQPQLGLAQVAVGPQTTTRIPSYFTNTGRRTESSFATSATDSTERGLKLHELRREECPPHQIRSEPTNFSHLELRGFLPGYLRSWLYTAVFTLCLTQRMLLTAARAPHLMHFPSLARRSCHLRWRDISKSVNSSTMRLTPSPPDRLPWGIRG